MKKKTHEIDKLKKMVFEKAKNIGTREILVHYIWDTCISLQLGYSFSLNHTTPYTVIAIQEMNLCLKYPIAYWNCACLSVNAGMDEGATNYAKMATAIGDIKSRNVNILYPSINKAGFAFKVVGDDIMFGLKGLTNIGDEVVNNIIKYRPYTSMQDLQRKLNLDKQQMISLIKAGAFDEIEKDKRPVVMAKYIKSIMETKKRLTMQQYPQVQAIGATPESMVKYDKIFEFNRYLKSECQNGLNYILDDRALSFFSLNLNTSLLKNIGDGIGLEIKEWEKFYNKEISPLKQYLADNRDKILGSLNRNVFFQEWNKYCSGSVSKWEMDSLSCYIGEHELKNVNIEKYGIRNFSDMPETPVAVDFFNIRGKRIGKFGVDSIVGTVIAKDKSKYVLTILTLDGVVNIKIRNEQFAFFDRQVSERQSDGTKKILEKSWFTKGNKLMLTGYRDGDQFRLKTYADTGKKSIYKIEDILQNGDLVLNSARAGE